MKLLDNTLEANSGEDMANYYLYHAKAENGRWGLSVEQPQAERFHVSALYMEPGWDMFGVVRYWVFADRAMAEARYLELQRIVGGLADELSLKEVLKALPPTDRGGRDLDGGDAEPEPEVDADAE